MPFDHFVPQVHLRKFYSDDFDMKKMYAFRKSNLAVFPCGSKDVCRAVEGSTTQFLENSRAIEEFIRPIERNYNWAVEEIMGGRLNENTVFVIAGFANFLQICSPTSTRIQAGSLEKLVECEAAILDKAGLIPKSPKELGGKSLSELLAERKIKIDVDQNFPKAIGVSNFRSGLLAFGNFRWEFLINRWEDSLFFTSDFPLAVEDTDDPRLINRIVPLSPNLAVRICPRLDLTPDELHSESFNNFRFRMVDLSRNEIRKVNQLIVRSAEDFVFSSKKLPWMQKFVAKNRRYHAEGVHDLLPSGDGVMKLTRIRLRESSQ